MLRHSLEFLGTVGVRVEAARRYVLPDLSVAIKRSITSLGKKASIIWKIIGGIAIVTGILTFFGISFYTFWPAGNGTPGVGFPYATPIPSSTIPAFVAPVIPPPTSAPTVQTLCVQGGNLSIARYLHDVILLQTGKVLVTGGKSRNNSLAISELYDPVTRIWSPTGGLNTARFWFGNVVMLNTGKVLIAGGTDISGYGDYSSVELYDPLTGTWSYTGRLNFARRNPTLTLLNDGRVLIAGGSSGLPFGGRFLDSSEIYDPATGRWSLGGRLKVAREGHTAVRLTDGKVLIVGGEGPWLQASNTSEVFDPRSNAWFRVGDMSVGRVETTLTLLDNGKVLVAGGRDLEYNSYDSADLFDPESYRWSPTSSMIASRARHSAIKLPNGNVMVIGGDDTNGSTNLAEVYDPTSQRWFVTGELQIPRADHKALLIGNSVLVVGGYRQTQTNQLASSELCRW